MGKKILKGFLPIAISLIFLSFELPTGWIKADSLPKSCDKDIDKGAGEDGKNGATIKSIDKDIEGFGTLMQTYWPDKFIGKRVKVVASIKTTSSIDGAYLWFRVDQCKAEEPLMFDNIYDRPVLNKVI